MTERLTDFMLLYTGLFDPALCPLDCNPLRLGVCILPYYFEDWYRLKLAGSPFHVLGRAQVRDKDAPVTLLFALICSLVDT